MLELDSLDLIKATFSGLFMAIKITWPLLLLSIVIAIVKVVFKSKKSQHSTRQNANESIESFTGKYRAQPVISARELNNFDTMITVAKKLGLHIFTKVRLADVITPKVREEENKKEFYRLFNKINKKHCDFVVYDSRLKLIAVIEIDDSTHNSTDRKQRYDFTDFVFKDCGIPMLHYTNVSAMQFEKDLREIMTNGAPLMAAHRSERF